jgi:hypothetical protein
MSPSRLALVLLFAFGSSLARAQQTATTSPPAASEGAVVLQKALAALAPTTPISDITLTGTARQIAGSDDESGTVVIKAVASGAARTDFSFPSGQREEVSNLTVVPPAGTWSGPDGIIHSIASHNLFTEPAWAFPSFAVARGLLSPGYVASYLGHETWNSTAVEHVVIYKQLPVSSGIADLVQHLSQQDIYFDSSTLLPVAVTFCSHPDRITTTDIPLEVRFSDYRSVNGVQVPFHVQKYMNNSLILDLQFTSAVLNSGISNTTFAVGAGL